MLKIKKLLGLLLVGLFSFSLFLSTGCAGHPNEKQISAMEEARSACLAAEQKLSDTQKNREDLEAQLSQKKAQLAKAQAEKEKVQQGLNNWQSEEE